MKKPTFLFLFILLLLALGCANRNTTKASIKKVDSRFSNFLRKHELPDYGFIDLNYSIAGRVGTTIKFYQLDAGFWSIQTATPHLSQHISLGDVQVGPSLIASYPGYQVHSPNAPPTGFPDIYCTNAMFSVPGAGGVAGFNQTLAIPAELKITAPTCYNNIYKSLPFTINWSTGQCSQGNDSVLIKLIYWGAESHHYDSTLPSKCFDRDFIVPDNGSYTLSVADMASIPVGGHIQINIYRVREKYFTNTDSRNYRLSVRLTAEYEDVMQK